MSAVASDRDELIRFATELADQDLTARLALVAARRAAGMSRADMARELGWSEKKVRRFERHDADPRQSHVRRYAQMVFAARASDTARS